MMKLRKLKLYRKESLDVRVLNFRLEKIVLVQEENLETILQRKQLVRL